MRLRCETSPQAVGASMAKSWLYYDYGNDIKKLRDSRNPTVPFVPSGCHKRQLNLLTGGLVDYYKVAIALAAQLLIRIE